MARRAAFLVAIAFVLTGALAYGQFRQRGFDGFGGLRGEQGDAAEIPEKAAPDRNFTACHMLATLSARSNSLAMLPGVSSSGDLLNLCLSQQLFPDALEQFNLYTHATDSIGNTVRLLVEVLTEMHCRRLGWRHA